MFKKPSTQLKIIFLFFLMYFSWIFLCNSLKAYASGPEKLSELSLEELKLKPVTTIEGKVGDLLRKWYAEGTAAGNAGDYYDNRDRGHSHPRMENYPQLQEIKYSKREREQRKDWAVQTRLYPYVVFGNSSTSAGRLNGGSNIRTYYSNPGGMAFLYKQYTHNNLYIYPTHRDYSSGINGDVFPTNSSYLIASKGSSGSDRKYINAVAQTLAAFQPDVKKTLVDTGFLMPTIQMILRYSAVNNWKEYLTGTAHPVAGIECNNLKMIEIAHKIQTDEIPPLVQLKVLEEDAPLNGEDFFSPGHSIKLADTPGVIARIFREKSYWHRIVVSAEASIDLNQRDLSYHWKVFKGPRKNISIRPINVAGSIVEIRIPYHERQSMSPQKKYMSNRVEIGVFVKAGEYFSAPGFITSFSLDNEARTYDEEKRILEIGYGMGNPVIEIIDWHTFFKMFNSQTDSIPGSILKNQYSRREIDFIINMAEEYVKIDDEIGKIEKKLDDKQGTDDKKDLQKKLRAQKKAKEKLITKKQRDLKYSIHQLVLREFDNFIEDPEFLNKHHAEIIGLFKTVSNKNRSIFFKELNRLENYGIIKKNNDFTIRITPLRQGSDSLTRRLTQFEYALIKNLNATVLSHLFFTDIVRSTFAVNFVDQRLIIPKFWRDVYHYNKTGQLLGWTRYNEAGKTEFNKDGLIVLDKDELDRCIKGQTVEYSQAPLVRDSQEKLPLANMNPLKQIPGREIWYYQYEDDSDSQGKVVKIEKI